MGTLSLFAIVIICSLVILTNELKSLGLRVM